MRAADAADVALSGGVLPDLALIAPALPIRKHDVLPGILQRSVFFGLAPRQTLSPVRLPGWAVPPNLKHLSGLAEK